MILAQAAADVCNTDVTSWPEAIVYCAVIAAAAIVFIYLLKWF
jgi:hypothetical protein